MIAGGSQRPLERRTVIAKSRSRSPAHRRFLRQRGPGHYDTRDQQSHLENPSSRKSFHGSLHPFTPPKIDSFEALLVAHAFCYF
jgi:hypothetical protein